MTGRSRTLAGVVALVLGFGPGVSLVIAIAVGVVGLVVFAATSMRVFGTIDRRFETRFPAPGRVAAPEAQEARRNT